MKTSLKITMLFHSHDSLWVIQFILPEMLWLICWNSLCSVGSNGSYMLHIDT